MRISVSHARQQLADLMRRAQRGEVVILTLRGQMPVRLIPIRFISDQAEHEDVPKEIAVEESQQLDDVGALGR